ncbi:MAG: hypothetical protein Q9163_003670 [Psora crenata]
MASGEELEELEKLSANYVPEQKGDLVGVRISSRILTSEYAKADPVYASKTRNLPETYPEYRTIKRDGNCGFRAIAFGYFEALVRVGNPKKTRGEAERLRSLNKLLDDTGQEAFMYEDWVELTLSLLEQTASASAGPDKEAALLKAFNDLDTANAITQHFRMITSAWMKLNPDDYAPFVPDLDVTLYCQNHIDPFYEEIEHVGVKALVDSIINPAGIAVECLYLDRSPGDQATSYSFPIYKENGDEMEDAPTIRLLYRPRGHYDLLYKSRDLVEPASLTSCEDSEPSGIKPSTLEIRKLQSLPQPILLNDTAAFFDNTGAYLPNSSASKSLPGIDAPAAYYAPLWHENEGQYAIAEQQYLCGHYHDAPRNPTIAPGPATVRNGPRSEYEPSLPTPPVDPSRSAVGASLQLVLDQGPEEELTIDPALKPERGTEPEPQIERPTPGAMQWAVKTQ